MARSYTTTPQKPLRTDIELFAKAYFNIELTTQQLEMIALIAAGTAMKRMRISRHSANEVALKIIRAYLQEGLHVNGRRRLPQHPLPVKEKFKGKGFTQSGKILALIKRPQGAYNFELSRVALKYSSRIAELRRDGHAIVADRQYLKNGKASNTWKYRMGGH
jgi:hypothetical protein